MKKKTTAVLVTLTAAALVCGGWTKEEGGKVAVGTNAEYAPFEYLDEKGNVTGFDVDLMNAIAEKAGLELEWVDMPFDALLGAMESGNIDVIAAALGPTEERKKSIDFSDVYYTGSQSVLCLEGADLKDFEAVSGKTIAVLEGSQSDLIASGENTDYGEVKDAEVKRFKRAADAIMELKNEAADAVIIDTIMANIFVEEVGGLEAHQVEGTEEDTVFGIQKGNTELAELLNEGLKECKEDGTYDELYESYFSDAEGKVE
ncbi:MAG: basic amino acid ABC transporter substrate-binding protein [Candidatus Limivivens sp.]|nr:basic amino acid ABC transporter substrate-binding protein [Candidatus Limivivens sp.]